jgi:hypothetical protein
MTLFASCNENSRSLTEYGEDVISLMTEMLESEEYKSMYDLPSEYDDEINMLREGNYSESIAVYEILVPEDELLDVVLDIDKEDLSKELYEYLCSSAYSSFATLINRISGSNSMVLSSAFTASKNYVSKDIDENKIYLFVFENGYPIAVTFVANGEGAVHAVGHFIINDEFITEDENSIKESCEKMGIDNVTVKKR